MIQELMPVLQDGRTLFITIAKVSPTEVQMTVVPKAKEGEEKDRIAILTTPIAVVGTPEELDALLPSVLTEFAATHAECTSTLDQAKAEMKSATDAIKAEADEKKKQAKGKPAKPEKKDEKAKGKKPAAQNGSLFDGSAEPEADPEAEPAEGEDEVEEGDRDDAPQD